MKQLILFVVLVFFSIQAIAHYKSIRIVGSSTLYPFITVAAEKFGKVRGVTPVVEATGTGGGFHLFCLGRPDIVNASRTIQTSEKELCKKNNVSFEEIIIGYDGIVVANSKEGKKLNLKKRDLFLALANKIPYQEGFIDNPYRTWKQINPKLPDNKIEIYGPSYTSGTRYTLIELIMHDFCTNPACREIREDGAYIEMPENDNLIIHKLAKNTQAIGIISFSLLAENSNVRAARINEVYPTRDSIMSSDYPLARPLYVYVNKDYLQNKKDLQSFIKELTSPTSIGPNGYLTQKGLLSKRS